MRIIYIVDDLKKCIFNKRYFYHLILVKKSLENIFSCHVNHFKKQSSTQGHIFYFLKDNLYFFFSLESSFHSRWFSRYFLSPFYTMNNTKSYLPQHQHRKKFDFYFCIKFNIDYNSSDSFIQKHLTPQVHTTAHTTALQAGTKKSQH